MARTLTLVNNLAPDELRRRYKTAPTTAEARRYHALWLVSQGSTALAAAALVGLSDKWVRLLVHRYNRHGPAGLTDRRSTNPGKPPLLAPAQQATLAALLDGPAPDGGLWAGPKVAAWIEQQTGRATYPQQGWVYLHRLGFSPQQPRPLHTDAASEEEQAAWKKSSTSGSLRSRLRTVR